MNQHPSTDKSKLFLLGSLGIVFGDIGTSPLYTLKLCFSVSQLPIVESNVLGFVSLILWSLILIVSYKYVYLVLKADNNGEGGILSLMALVKALKVKKKRYVLLLGIFGTGLFYGDGVITPAISVLGALEGLEEVSPKLVTYIMPISAALIVFLFLLQQKGTEKIGFLFGPVMVLWFGSIGFFGLLKIFEHPAILQAINPLYALSFISAHKFLSLSLFGVVMLAITGAEALYSDLGHFNRRSIQLNWTFFVFPALALNYMGQGAFLLTSPEAIGNLFYKIVPAVFRTPMIFLAAASTIIASQAVISGVFSLTSQAIQLGLLPRMYIRHTSSSHFGQIYMPVPNFMMMMATILTVLLFQTTDALSYAYGLTVSTIMLITSFLLILVMRKLWQWSIAKIMISLSVVLFFEFLIWASNMTKIIHGAWFSIVVSTALVILMITWVRGREALAGQAKREQMPLKEFVKIAKKKTVKRIKGIGVYFTSTPKSVPPALRLNLQHQHVLHEKVVILTFNTLFVPRAHRSKRITIIRHEGEIYSVSVDYGYMEIPNVMRLMESINHQIVQGRVDELSYFVSRGVPTASTSPILQGWAEKLFIWMAKNANSASDFFSIPHRQVVEYGIRYRV